MKKIIVLSFLLVSTQLFSIHREEREKRFNGALSAGYVFKHDCRFKEVYGHGVINIITADGCYYPWELWGIGIKASYWRSKRGHTTFLGQCTRLHEVPVTAYLRRVKDFHCGLEIYASLGGGFAWLKEKSYLGDVHAYKAIGEAEVGLWYPVWRCVNLVGAFRYIFPRQSVKGRTSDVGGLDLRAGLGFEF